MFESSDAAKLIPILGRIHSVRPNHQSEEGKIIFSNSSPFIIGFHLGKEPIRDVNQFLAFLMDELQYLSPLNLPRTGSSRVLTVSVRAVIADGPMRSFLKCTKSHSGYWACDRCIQKGERLKNILEYRHVSSPPRLDSEFTSYHVNDISVDEHIPNPRRMSPFLDISFPMVSGFVIDPMHTMLEGAFGRRLEGLANVRDEGKLTKTQLVEVNRRICLYKNWKVNDFDRSVGKFEDCARYKCHVKRQFLYYLLFPVFENIVERQTLDHLMILQHAMILLGTFKNEPVEKRNIDKAESLLKNYVVELHDRNIPIRFVSHQIIHLPRDVETYKSGIETLSAFQYENFQKLFRTIIRSGNLPATQIRNRLVEKANFQLPTTPSGVIIEKNFQSLIKLVGDKNRAIKIVWNGRNLPKRLIFPNYELLNKEPNNICLMHDRSVVVCKDFEFSDGSYQLIGCKFNVLRPAFDFPFASVSYDMFLGSEVSSSVLRFSASHVKAKVYALPRNPKCVIHNFDDPNQYWYLFPLHHTLSNSITGQSF